METIIQEAWIRVFVATKRLQVNLMMRFIWPQPLFIQLLWLLLCNNGMVEELQKRPTVYYLESLNTYYLALYRKSLLNPDTFMTEGITGLT